jgi:26S proteasome regulatory subunit N1
MRHLALEIGKEFTTRLNEDQHTDDLTDLALVLVPFFLKHNAEADAIDLLSEVEMIEQIAEYLNENTFSKVCAYIVRYA